MKFLIKMKKTDSSQLFINTTIMAKTRVLAWSLPPEALQQLNAAHLSFFDTRVFDQNN